MDISLSFFIFFTPFDKARGRKGSFFFPELAEMTTDGAIHLRGRQERRGNSPRRREGSAGDSAERTSHLSASFLVQESVRKLPAR